MAPRQRCSREEFIRLFEEHGAQKTADRLNLAVRDVYKRRLSLERQLGRTIKNPVNRGDHWMRPDEEHPGRINLEIQDGIVLVASDCHYWPGPPSLMHRAFVKFCKEMQPKTVIMNGDVCDFGQISRHPPIGWEKLPTVEQEIEATKERLHEIVGATHRARKIWTLGNHDSRFSTRLATHAKEYGAVHGFKLKDHFDLWEPCWSVWINSNIVVKHRWKGGDYATRNNTIKSGKTIVTGHLHTGHVDPWSDYNGTRWGVDGGTIADPYGPQFRYLEDNPRNWRQAFVCLTLRKGRLLWPELVVAFDEEHVEFRSEVIRV